MRMINSFKRRFKRWMVGVLRSAWADFCICYFRLRLRFLRIMGLDPVFKGLDSSLVKAGALSCFCSDGGVEVSSLTFGHPSDGGRGGCGLPHFGSEQQKAIVDTLKNKGFCVIQDFVSQDVCAGVVDFARRTRCYPRPQDGRALIPPEVLSKPYKSARYDFSPNVHQLFEIAPLVDMMSNWSLVDVAEAYFGSKAYLDPVELWWFLPFGVRDPAWAENYHFDFDAFRWLKFFVNFEDISLDVGPHCFIEASHKPSRFKSDLVKEGYSRLSDEQVIDAYGHGAEKVFEVPLGSLLIEDTSGFHKGLTPVTGRRLLFSFQWSNSLFLDHKTLRRRKKYTAKGNALDQMHSEGRLDRYFY